MRKHYVLDFLTPCYMTCFVPLCCTTHECTTLRPMTYIRVSTCYATWTMTQMGFELAPNVQKYAETLRFGLFRVMFVTCFVTSANQVMSGHKYDPCARHVFRQVFTPIRDMACRTFGHKSHIQYACVRSYDPFMLLLTQTMWAHHVLCEHLCEQRARLCNKGKRYDPHLVCKTPN